MEVTPISQVNPSVPRALSLDEPPAYSDVIQEKQ
jgi:hypothetical protein